MHFILKIIFVVTIVWQISANSILFAEDDFTVVREKFGIGRSDIENSKSEIIDTLLGKYLNSSDYIDQALFSKSVFIIITYKNFNTQKSVNHSFCEGISTFVFQDGKINNKIVDRDDIYILFIGSISSDNAQTISLNYDKTLFSKSFLSLTQLASKLILETSNQDYIMGRLIKVYKNKIKPPMSINVSLQWSEFEDKLDPKDTSKTLSIESVKKENCSFSIYELNVLLFQVGVTSSHLNRKLFKIENGSLTVSLDDDTKKEWKQNLIFILDLHWPREPESYLNSIFDNWDKPWRRMGIALGMSLYKDPLAAFYAGATFSLSKELTLLAGFSWENEYQTGVTNIGNINTLSDAKEFINRKYGRPQFFWGITLNPEGVKSRLGL